MEIIVARHSGFCFGVDKAVKSIDENINTEQGLYTFGPIIHNKNVTDDYAKKGVSIVEDEDKAIDGAIIIRAHGVPPEVEAKLNKNAQKVIDSTCPFVKRIHKIVAKQYEQGDAIVIIGNKNHPETIGIKGYANNEAQIITTEEEANNLHVPLGKPITVVSQTTFDLFKFNKIVEILKNLGYNLNIFSTICKATHDRQLEASDLAKKVDRMIVIGGRHSSNTTKLFDICKSKCPNTYHIENVQELNLQDFSDADVVGITAGASTPDKIIDEVITTLRRVF